MDYKALAEELCQLHITYAGAMNQMLDGVSAKGEDGLVLWLSRRNQETFPTDIARHFHISTGRVANILKRVERKKLIERKAVSEDLRKTEIVLTSEGKTYAQQFYANIVEEHKNVLELLGEEEAVQLLQVIRHILQMVESRQLKETA